MKKGGGKKILKLHIQLMLTHNKGENRREDIIKRSIGITGVLKKIKKSSINNTCSIKIGLNIV